METVKEMKEMVGKSGSEKLIFSPDYNTIFGLGMWEETLERVRESFPKIAARYEKNAYTVIHTWTWASQFTKHAPGNMCLVKINNTYYRADNDEVVLFGK